MWAERYIVTFRIMCRTVEIKASHHSPDLSQLTRWRRDKIDCKVYSSTFYLLIFDFVGVALMMSQRTERMLAKYNNSFLTKKNHFVPYSSASFMMSSFFTQFFIYNKFSLPPPWSDELLYTQTVGLG